MERREPVIALKSVDLPALGLPTITTTGRVSDTAMYFRGIRAGLGGDGERRTAPASESKGRRLEALGQSDTELIDTRVSGRESGVYPIYVEHFVAIE